MLVVCIYVCMFVYLFPSRSVRLLVLSATHTALAKSDLTHPTVVSAWPESCEPVTFFHRFECYEAQNAVVNIPGLSFALNLFLPSALLKPNCNNIPERKNTHQGLGGGGCGMSETEHAWKREDARGICFRRRKEPSLTSKSVCARVVIRLALL